MFVVRVRRDSAVPLGQGSGRGRQAEHPSADDSVQRRAVPGDRITLPAANPDARRVRGRAAVRPAGGAGQTDGDPRRVRGALGREHGRCCLLRAAGVAVLPGPRAAGAGHCRRQLHHRRESPVKLADFAVLSCGVLLNALAQLGLKAATQVSGPLVASDAHVLRRALDLLVVPSLWYALGAYGLSVVVWLVGLSRVPVSQAYPLLSLGYVLNIGLAWWLLGEAPNAQRVVGIGVIVLGVWLVARS
ncbi:MAG: hypothetical protein E6K52_02180 [Gammaproteobacteria bacterium]|nr:MAG: hypothetical protein E6K52_02180 [Gammaproteobacteria bacterium]